MKPYIILHNSITLDGSLTGFMPDMELHYRLAGRYAPEANLIGSETIIAGQEMFGEGIPDEEERDFEVPLREQDLPWWVVVDSGGRLSGMLHTCRRFEYCKDVIVLVSESTPEDYLKHLEERNYRYIKTGKVKVDLRSALSLLAEEYGIKKILTDTGQVLGSILINESLVDEISLVVNPLIKGVGSYYIFGGVTSDTRLSLMTEERFENGCIWLTYKVG
jgi:2,5-diamino-6-(ribosylamino)-4(3H)-pyrimidinone 5'-phosphate reductase